MLENDLIRYVLLALSGMSFLVFAARVFFDWQKDRLIGAKGQEMDGDALPSKGDLDTVEKPASYEDKVLTLSSDDQKDAGGTGQELGYAAQVDSVFEQTQDDLTKIEGVGPKTEELLNTAGVYSYAKLARIKPIRLKALLDKAGGTFKMHDPSSWPQQAELAARGDWKKLIHLQDRLSARAKKQRADASSYHKTSRSANAPKDRRKLIQ